MKFRHYGFYLHGARYAPAVFVAVVASLTGRSEGAIAFTTGAMTEIFSPVSFVEGATESSTSIVILDEGVVTLSAAVLVNAFGVGTFGGTVPPLTSIPEGTLVNSYLVHFDPVGGGFATLTGDVFFEPGEVIIGIQTHTPLLYAADPIVGDPAATYPPFMEFRGFETLPGPDSVTIPPGMASASFTMFAELGIDHARIFTAPVPAPAAGWLLGGFAGVLMRRRRSSSGAALPMGPRS